MSTNDPAQNQPTITRAIAARAVSLCLAAAADRLASIPEPVVAGMSDECPTWKAETDRLDGEKSAALSLVGSVEEQTEALSSLRSSRWVRRLARRAVVARWGESAIPLPVHAYGPGWRDAGSAILGDARQ